MSGNYCWKFSFGFEDLRLYRDLYVFNKLAVDSKLAISDKRGLTLTLMPLLSNLIGLYF